MIFPTDLIDPLVFHFMFLVLSEILVGSVVGDNKFWKLFDGFQCLKLI